MPNAWGWPSCTSCADGWDAAPRIGLRAAVQTPLSELARARLKIIYELTDGFEIARQDLLLRGPGELLGAARAVCRCCALPISNAMSHYSKARAIWRSAV